MITEKQRIGLALERLTYKTLRSLLQSRLGLAGKERKDLNGPVWEGKNFALFWNKQVVKSGYYPKGIFKNGMRRRLADVVLCNNELPDIKPSHLEWEPPLSYAKAILAIECKNNNLDFRWGHPSHVEGFDNDVMSRFIWGDMSQVLGFDVDWERYAGFKNIFPRAAKVLLMPNFIFTEKAKQDKPVEMNNEVELYFKGKRQEGLMPPSFSPYDCIVWRIKRLKLNILELGYQPMPSKAVPDKVKQRLTSLLKPYLENVPWSYQPLPH